MGVKSALAFAAGLLVLGSLWGCPQPAKPSGQVSPGNLTPVPAQLQADARWQLYSARRQTQYLKLDLPVIVSGMRIAIGAPLAIVKETKNASLLAATTIPATDASATQSADPQPSTRNDPIPREMADKLVPAEGWDQDAVIPYSSRILRGAVEGPLVEQLTGRARESADAGSYLVPLNPVGTPTPAGDKTYEVKEPMPLYIKVVVPATVDPGEYRIPITLAMPGKPPEGMQLALQVADIAFPTEPRVLGVATTTVEQLAKIYPESFGSLPAQYLDRADPEHKPAVDQLDALVKAARAQGVSLFIENMIPTIHVDEVGGVTLDWDAYDRLMQPYMDGTAFPDRLPLPVWLAPVPPRRIRDSSTQLWQYIDACAKHFSAKGWTATPAFLHPALAGGQADALPLDPAEAEKLKTQVGEMMRLHMPRDMLAVAAPGADVPHGQLWTVNDQDPRLPPAGLLAGEQSVRAWPWVCIARGNALGGSPTGVKGFVWRDALARAEDLKSVAGGVESAGVRMPLFVAEGKEIQILPTLRMLWLNQGLNDAALLGLLEKRTDAARSGVISEILAGVVGRTGMTADPRQDADPSALPSPAPGFLYAGWPLNKGLWSNVTPALQQLILASDPGTRGSMKPDDPLYLSAKLWLAQTRRPAARVTGFTFGLRPATRGGGDILDARVRLLVENPIEAAADIDFRFANLPGDFDVLPVAGATGDDLLLRQRTMTLPASAAGEIVMPLASHVEALMEAPATETLELREAHAGAILRLGVKLPIYRMHALDATMTAPKLDGDAADWPLDNQTRLFGEMKVATRLLTRPDFVAGSSPPDDKAASIRWTFDKDYLYMLAKCPQDSMSDDRNTEWPLRQVGDAPSAATRWWGSDGLILQLATMPPAIAAAATPASPSDATDRILKIAFKPTGVVLIKTGQLVKDPKTAASIDWKDGPPIPAAGMAAANLRYGIAVQKQDGRILGYTIEAAIPRAWIDATPADAGSRGPAWRVNVLRHRAADLVTASWGGPMVNDDDFAMMGVLLGE
ncbi:MAG TPA: hypothetical protein VGN88_07565 [Phycisphaerae bacterium]|jgi:hypothetical protein